MFLGRIDNLFGGHGRDYAENLERVLSVLDGRQNDESDSCIVLRSLLRAEASDDLEFGLGRSEGLFAAIVRRGNFRVRQEGEDVSPVLGDALLELVQFRFESVSLGV